MRLIVRYLNILEGLGVLTKMAHDDDCCDRIALRKWFFFIARCWLAFKFVFLVDL